MSDLRLALEAKLIRPCEELYIKSQRDDHYTTLALLLDCVEALRLVIDAGDDDGIWVNNWSERRKQCREALQALRAHVEGE